MANDLFIHYFNVLKNSRDRDPRHIRSSQKKIIYYSKLFKKNSEPARSRLFPHGTTHGLISLPHGGFEPELNEFLDFDNPPFFETEFGLHSFPARRRELDSWNLDPGSLTELQRSVFYTKTRSKSTLKFELEGIQ